MVVGVVTVALITEAFWPYGRHRGRRDLPKPRLEERHNVVLVELFRVAFFSSERVVVKALVVVDHFCWWWTPPCKSMVRHSDLNNILFPFNNNDAGIQALLW